MADAAGRAPEAGLPRVGNPDGEAQAGSTRVWTIPNALSVLRLFGVPLFLWLVLVEHADRWALVVLMVAGFTDWLDGHLARAWNQTTRLGQLLDPAADRLYILATVVGLTLRDIIPLWFALVLVLRDVLLLAGYPLLSRHGYGPLPVHFLGKAATFCLLYAFPLLLLGGGADPTGVQFVSAVLGWAFAVWGTTLYWWAGLLYLYQARRLLLRRPERAAPGITAD